ncbi:hypothetical protein C3L33_12592, partial [Rhododendron williamsianum]
MTMGAEEGGDRDDYTEDGTVDLKGNPVRRSKIGGWKACSFVGMSLLTLSISLPGLKPPYCSDPSNCKKASVVQLAVFFGALNTLAIGTGGTKPNISTIGADQFDEFEPKEKAHKLSFFNWWMFSIFFGTLFATTFLVYIQENVGWALGYGIPTTGLALSILIFLIGTPFTSTRFLLGVHLQEWQEYTKKGKFRIDSTPTLRYFWLSIHSPENSNPVIATPLEAATCSKISGMSFIS